MSTFTVFFPKQSVRSWTFTFLVVVGTALILISLFAGENGMSLQPMRAVQRLRDYTREFKAAELTALITPVVALLTAWFAHYGDERYGGRGIKHIVKRMGRECYNLDTNVIAGSMTKQSVLAAIASILVALVQQYQSLTTYGFLIKFLTTCGFGFTILFLLVSMVCYDYASRFQWRPFHKAQLVRKALLLDVWSWYFLLTSFVLSIALISPRLSVATCVSAGILMWWYYFFPKRRSKDLSGASEKQERGIDESQTRWELRGELLKRRVWRFAYDSERYTPRRFRMAGLKVEISRFVHEGQPNVVECTFCDVNGKEHSIIEKVPVVTTDELGPNDQYPRPEVIACTVVHEKSVDDLEVVEIDTRTPWRIESIKGESLFEVRPDQLIEL